jgi:hypothetical protein
MAKKSKDRSAKRPAVYQIRKDARSLHFAENGVRNGRDFADLMSNLMSDLLAQRISPRVGTAVCNAGGKLLKVVELQFKYGTGTNVHGRKDISLALEDKGRK